MSQCHSEVGCYLQKPTVKPATAQYEVNKSLYSIFFI